MSIKKTSIHRPSLREIRQIFPSAIGVGLILDKIGQGLHIEFRNRANFFEELKKTPDSSVIYSKPLYSLTTSFGFVTLNNCWVPNLNNYSGLSFGSNKDGSFIQDSFHRDYHPYQNIYVTVMLRQPVAGKDNHNGRREDSFYALEDDVREATSKLDTRNLSDSVVQSLAEFQKTDYRFRLFDSEEKKAREIIQQHYPDYTQAVFDLIPKERKYAKSWKAGIWDMALHANDLDSGFLHGRPTGHYMQEFERPFNPIRGLEIYKG